MAYPSVFGPVSQSFYSSNRANLEFEVFKQEVSARTLVLGGEPDRLYREEPEPVARRSTQTFGDSFQPGEIDQV